MKSHSERRAGGPRLQGASSARRPTGSRRRRTDLPQLEADSMDAPRTATRKELEHYFSRLDLRWEAYLKQKNDRDRRLAEDFSVFPFIRVDENTLSDILAFLLDPNETHGQRELFLKVFARHIRWQTEAKWSAARVVREARTYAISSHRRRIDIVVTAPGTTLAIENKIDAEEEEDQVHDYHAHVSRDTRRDYCVIFLTPDGRPPNRLPAKIAAELRRVGKLRLLSHAGDIHEWLKECRRECKAPSVKHFLGNILSYFETHFTQA
jgi:hypothetical protein